MRFWEVIKNRRSHRQFSNAEISTAEITEIVNSGIFAPSPKNRQPWGFILCGPKTKDQVGQALTTKLNQLSSESKYFGSLPISIKSIKGCSKLLLVYNIYSQRENSYNKNRWKADIQSIGACIQNMLLMAHTKNIQTLWICDILFAEKEINKIVDTDDELAAAVAFGKGTRKEIPVTPRVELKKKIKFLD